VIPDVTRIDYRIWKAMAWAGPLFMAVFVVGWGVLAGNIPPVGPGVSPEELQTWFTTNSTPIAIGTSVCLTITSLYMVWGCAISHVMRRIEGRGGLLANLEQMGAVITCAPITVAMGLFLTCSREAAVVDAATVHMLYHLGWFIFDLAYMVTSFQIAAISIVFMRDKREKQLVPNWVSWWGWVTFASFFPVSLIPFFSTGPFAWNGSFNFWIAFFAWFIWCPLVSTYVIKAIGRIQAEDEAAGITLEDEVGPAAVASTLSATEVPASPAAAGGGVSVTRPTQPAR
jgi:hypothetical protein